MHERKNLNLQASSVYNGFQLLEKLNAKIESKPVEHLPL